MTINGIFFIDSIEKCQKIIRTLSMTHLVLSMLAAVWGRTSPVYTRLEAVRKMIRTVVGLVLAELVLRSR